MKLITQERPLLKEESGTLLKFQKKSLIISENVSTTANIGNLNIWANSNKESYLNVL